MVDYKDNGYKSRKMVMAYIVMLLMTIGFLFVGKWPALAVAYAEYCMGLLAASAIFVGGNTMTKWIATRRTPNVESKTSKGEK